MHRRTTGNSDCCHVDLRYESKPKVEMSIISVGFSFHGVGYFSIDLGC